MKNSKFMSSLLGMALATSMLNDKENITSSSSLSGYRKHIKSHLTKKQRHNRIKEKARRKANAKQRRKWNEKYNNCWYLW